MPRAEKTEEDKAAKSDYEDNTHLAEKYDAAV